MKLLHTVFGVLMVIVQLIDFFVFFRPLVMAI